MVLRTGAGAKPPGPLSGNLGRALWKRKEAGLFLGKATWLFYYYYYYFRRVLFEMFQDCSCPSLPLHRIDPQLDIIFFLYMAVH